MKWMLQQSGLTRVVSPCRGLRWVWVIAFLALAAGGCDRRGVEEHIVEKGIEQVPVASEKKPPAPPQSQAVTAHAEESAEPADRWILPNGWTRDATPRPMRLATFIAPDADGPIEVAVTRFPGRVGGELANINRWRGQLGLAPITQAQLDETMTRFTSPGFEGYQTRIESQAGVMLAVAVYEAAIDQTWFVRATVASPAVADRLQPDLFALARSIATPEAEDDAP